jgi:myo-inositol 2-dehydrogenase / D-chiro-inositol 1-dehydrogenase
MRRRGRKLSKRPAPLSLDRRTFLRASTAAAAPFVFGCQAAPTTTTPITTAPVVLPPPPRPIPAEAIRVGIVGCGGRGTGAALNALLAKDGQVYLTAACDVFPDRMDSSLKELEASLGDQADRLRVDRERRFVGFDAYKQVIDSGVDVVILSTPPHFRPVHLAYAIQQGKHVFCEKPIAVDAPGVRSVMETVELARQKKLVLVSGLCWRYNDRHRELYRRIHDGAIGEVRAFYSTYNGVPNATVARTASMSDMEMQIRNWYHFPWLSGDHVVEQAVHSLDKMAWTFKDVPPKSVVAIGGRSVPGPAERGYGFDHFGATFDYGDGVKGFHMARQWAGCATENNDYLYGAKGRAVIKGWDPLHEIDGENPWKYEGEGNEMYQQELDEMMAAVRAGTEKNDGTYMCRSTLLGIMVRMAAYTGRVITWEEALASQERLGPAQYALGPVSVPGLAVPGQTPFA